MNQQPSYRGCPNWIVAARRLAIAVCILTVGLPSVHGGVVRYIPISNDSDCQIDLSKTYTHLLDFGSGTAATINGVSFNGATVGYVDATSNISYTVSSGSRNHHTGNGSHNVSGNLVDLMQDMIYNGGNDAGGTAMLTLSELMPGKLYDARVYVRSWGTGGTSGRTSNITFDPDGAGPETNTVTIHEDGAAANPPGFPDGNQAYIMAYQFQATASGLTIEFEQLAYNAAWHQYGLTNEEIKPYVIPTLYSTGLDDNREMLVPGTSDPHWELTSAPPGYTDAVKITPHPAWLAAQAEDENSGWIGAAEPFNTPPGTYTYETTFNLSTGFLPETAELTLAIARDDSLSGVRLNGNPVSYSQAGYTLGSPFMITSGFVQGINTLEVLVLNGGASANPHGVRVEISGTAQYLPEPGSIILLILGSIALLPFGWRRRRPSN